MDSSAIILAILIIVAIAAGVWFYIRWRNEQHVKQESLAFRELVAINARYGDALAGASPTCLTFEARTNTKPKFDRFDLRAYMFSSILEHETRIEQLLSGADYVNQTFSQYQHELALAWNVIGSTKSERLSSDAFVRIESRMLAKCALKAPDSSVTTEAIVRYTSPKGQNAYWRSLSWTHEDLKIGFLKAREDRRQRSTLQAQRQRERAKMSASMRATALRRGGSRCRMCGATPAHGVVLHVDHIVPVSRGGKTVIENLQILCESCNIGKGNRFVG